jgi:hypothetical protein
VEDIFTRIKNKALGFIQGVGNFRASPNTPTVSQTIQQVPNVVKNLGTSFADYGKQSNIPYAEQATGFLGRNIVQPFLDIPKNVQATFAPNKTAGERILSGMQAVGGAVPGVDDILSSTIMGGYNKLAGKRFTEGFTGEDIQLPGTTLFKGSGLEAPANIASLAPLLLMGGIKKTPKGQLDLFSNTPKKAVSDVLSTPTVKTVDQVLQPNIVKNVEVGGDLSPTISKQLKKPKTPKVDIFGGNTVKEEAGLVKSPGFWERKTSEYKRIFNNNLPKQLADQSNEKIFGELRTRNANAVDFSRDIEKQIVALGDKFKKGSKYSELTQKFGEGLIDEPTLVKLVGEKGAGEIINADNVFRNVYLSGINKVNELRRADGLPEIKVKSNYYRHFNDAGSLFDDISSGTTTQAKSLSIQKQRTGNQTKYDAVGGMLGWLEGAKRAGFTDKVAQDLNMFGSQLSKSGASPEFLKTVKSMSDDILGIKEVAPLERTLSKISTPIKKSKVVGNVSTLVNQFMGIPQAMWDARPDRFLKGNLSKEIRKLSDTSEYLKIRSSSVNPKLLGGIEGIDNAVSRPMKIADQTAATLIHRGFVAKAKAMGVADPVKWADDATEAAIGSRGIGGGSEWLNSPIGKILTPFVAEPTSQMNRLKEMIGEKRFGTLIGIVGTNYLLNKITEVSYGQTPLIDPIDAAIDSYRTATGDEDTKPNILQAALRVPMEALKSDPVANSLFANAYSLGETMGLPDSRDVFGKEDTTNMNLGYLKTKMVKLNLLQEQ